MKKKIILCSILLLAGCEKSYHDASPEFQMPPEMKDCKVFKLSDGVKNLYAIRCSLQTTTVTSGKSPLHTTMDNVGEVVVTDNTNEIVVNGITYVRK